MAESGKRITKEEYDNLISYLHKWVSISREFHPFFDEFMLSPIRKRYNDTLSEFLVNDALEAGL